MAIILPFGDKRPRIGQGVFLAPNATIIGDVEIADEASIWFGAVLRGDVGPIRIGPRSNVQDLACIHMTGGSSVTRVGADVTIGHGAILHGCGVGDRCLIGMGSILLDNARIGEGSVVAAGSLVSARSEFPARSLIRGRPARLVREVTEIEGALGIDGAVHYLEAARQYRSMSGTLHNALPMAEPPSIRPAPPLREARGEHAGERERSMSPGRERERALDFGNDRGGGED
ncbi:carbonic anhydrase, family 3 [Minicystis rosea]|nr:carbonic anhydrase, family 3 [Minicystis rosea]